MQWTSTLSTCLVIIIFLLNKLGTLILLHIYWFDLDLIQRRCLKNNWLFDVSTSCVGKVETTGVAEAAKLVLTTGCKLTVAYCTCSMKLMQVWSTSNWGCCWDCCLLSNWGIWAFDATELFADVSFDRVTCVICECGEFLREVDIEELSELSTLCLGRVLDATDFDVFDDLFGHCVIGAEQDVVTCRHEFQTELQDEYQSTYNRIVKSFMTFECGWNVLCWIKNGVRSE